jgi:hypothetical protein
MKLEDAIHIRTVNGDGPPCGCGKPSRLRHHVGALSPRHHRPRHLPVRPLRPTSDGGFHPHHRTEGLRGHGRKREVQGLLVPRLRRDRETHKDTCSFFPGQPVVHGNRGPPPWEEPRYERHSLRSASRVHPGPTKYRRTSISAAATGGLQARGHGRRTCEGRARRQEGSMDQSPAPPPRRGPHLPSLHREGRRARTQGRDHRGACSAS